MNWAIIESPSVTTSTSLFFGHYVDEYIFPTIHHASVTCVMCMCACVCMCEREKERD